MHYYNFAQCDFITPGAHVCCSLDWSWIYPPVIIAIGISEGEPRGALPPWTLALPPLDWWNNGFTQKLFTVCWLFVSRSKYSNREVTILMKQSLHLIDHYNSSTNPIKFYNLAPLPPPPPSPYQWPLDPPMVIASITSTQLICCCGSFWIPHLMCRLLQKTNNCVPVSIKEYLCSHMQQCIPATSS